MKFVRKRFFGIALASAATGLLAGSAAAVELSGTTTATLGWNAASGPVAGYYVMVSRDGGPIAAEGFTGETFATVSGEVGETLVVRTSAFDSDGAVGPLSLPSVPITFVPSPDPSDGGGAGSVPASGRTALDFDGDGFSDLLIRGSESETLTLWSMRGSSVRAVTPLASLEPSSALVGTGDYDGDGRADMLLEDRDAGRLELWVLDESLRPSVSEIGGEGLEPGGEWRVGGSGDFDGDGDDDVFFFSRTLGAVEIAFMDAARVVSRSRFDGHTGAWVVAALADVNGDGRTDIVWRDLLAEELEIMWLDVSGALQSRPLRESVAGLAVVGFGDYDGDGTQDLVMQSASSSRLSAWIFESGRLADVMQISAVPGVGYSALARGDYDADGLLDVVWSNDAERVIELWLSTEEGVVVSSLVGAGLAEPARIVSGALGSDESAFYARFCDADVTGDGVVNFRDDRRFRSCVGKPAEKRCDGADLDSDGWVTEIDYAQFLRLGDGTACGTTH